MTCRNTIGPKTRGTVITRNRLAHMIIIASLIFVAAAFLPGQAFSQQGLVPVKEKLKDMNDLLQEAIDDYKNDDIEEDELVILINKVSNLKREVMDQFPMAFGTRFSLWYGQFSALDWNLDLAYEWAGDSMKGETDVLRALEGARPLKDRLEAIFEEASTPWRDVHFRMAIKKLKKMNEDLQQAIDDYKNDVIEEDELQKRIDELRDLKLEVMDQFPDAWGTSFRQWFIEFEVLNEYLFDAKVAADMPGIFVSETDVLKILANARKSKDKLERWLIEFSDDREGEKVGSAWTPPTGTTRIAAVGTVRDEEVRMTSRGSIGGTVILETEDGEELAVAVPDEDGHFTLDFGDIATAAEVATLVLTALDSDGNPQARTTVEYLPGTPAEVAGPPAPTHPEIPYLENHQLHELEGQNFGVGTEVVVTDEQGEAILQETLSSSTDRVMYFLDGTVGPKEVRVWNELGSSEPFEIGVYEFGVTAGKTSLIRGETTSVNAFYEGLPAGTRIVFTNLSENVNVTPNGEAEVAGNDITFTVGESAGEVSMDVRARQSGDWRLDYRLDLAVPERGWWLCDQQCDQGCVLDTPASDDPDSFDLYLCPLLCDPGCIFQPDPEAP